MEEYGWQSATEKPVPKRRRNIDQLTKSYMDLVAEAITSTPTKTMTVGEICAYLKQRFGSGKSEITLKNTVRHTLSCYSIFKKVRKEEYNRPALWTVMKEEYLGVCEPVNQAGPSGVSSVSPQQREFTLMQTTFKWEEVASRLIKYSKTMPVTRSASLPTLLTDDPESEMFPDPPSARCSLPAYLDQTQ